MNKKILYFIIILTLIISLFGIRERILIEQSNKNIEMAFEYKSLIEMREEYDNQTITIEELKNYGINSIILTPYKIEELIELGEVTHLTHSDIKKREIFSEAKNAFWNDFPLKDRSAFLIFEEENNFLNNLYYFKEDLNLRFKEVNNQKIVFFPFWKEDYLELELGFDSKLIKDIEDLGLDIVYRFENLDINDLNYNLLSTLNENDTIVFSGEEILGFPDEIEKTAETMKNNNNIFGYIEAIVGVQEGEYELAKRLNYNIVRVHSITQDEMNIYSQSKIVDRYLRAIRERNIRFLYLRPIIKENQDFAEAKLKNGKYIRELKDELTLTGYTIDKAKPYQNFSNSSIILIFTALGILSAGIILLIEIFKIKEDLLKYILMILGIIGIWLTYIFLEINLFRAGLALVSSIVFPSIAIISELLKKDKQKNIFNYIKAALITLTGSVFVISALADSSYLTKINQFRGVKLAFLMPLFIVIFYYFMEYVVREKKTTIQERLKDILELNLKVKHLVILIFVGLAGIYYILRTGNFPILDIPSIEEKVRIVLEDLLYIRPRFKEFLIGHPVFITALYFFKDLKNNYGLLFLGLLAVIGQINILNSFAHIHTPVLISLLRTVHGLWLGLIVGLVIVGILKYLFGYFKAEGE